MKNKKIAILGKGTAGAQAAAYFAAAFPQHEIDWYFDPNRATQSVGEGSTLELPTALYKNLGFVHGDLKKIDGTFKTGIYKDGWGEKHENFFHDFPPPTSAYHFNAVRLQEYIEERLRDKVNIISKEVSYENVDADFVFNATGTPNNFEGFEQSEFIPVNSAYITQCYWDAPRFDYTLTLAAKHGWVFGIPLQNRLSIGYLYNKDISREEDLKEELAEIFEKYGVVPSSDTNSLNFNNYYRKQNYENGGRLVHSGNASFFLEPLEATSISTMHMIQKHAETLWHPGLDQHLESVVNRFNSEYKTWMGRTEFIIMMHYATGSKFKTDFWEYAKERGLKKLESSRQDPKMKLIYDTVRGGEPPNLFDPVLDYSNWTLPSFVQNIRGLGLENVMEKVFGDRADENHDFFSGSGSSYVVGKHEATTDEALSF